MKNILNLKFITLLVFGALFSGFTFDENVRSQVVVNPDRVSVAIEIRNLNSADMVCLDSYIELNFAQGEYMDFLGTTRVDLGAIDLEAGKDLKYQSYGTELTQQLRGQNSSAYIANAKIEIKGCKQTNLDYFSKFISLDPEEQHTLNMIFKAADVSIQDSPAKIKQEIGKNVTLSGSNIRNLRPFLYLPWITRLNISGNSLTNLEALKNLDQLSELDISRNKEKIIGVTRTLSKLIKLTSLSMNNMGQEYDYVEIARGTPNLTSMSVIDNNVSYEKAREICLANENLQLVYYQFRKYTICNN